MFGHLESPPSILFLVKHASIDAAAARMLRGLENGLIEEHRHFAGKESRLIWTLLIGPNLFYPVKCVLEAAAWHFRLIV